MALNIAAQQVMVSPVDAFLEGRALRRAEEEGAMRMKALQNAEGRAAEEGKRQAARFDWEQTNNKVQMDERAAKQTLAGAKQVLAIPKGERKAFVEKNFPDFVKTLSEQEYGWDEVDEDEIEEMAMGLSAQSASALGLSPEKATPFSDAGKVAADVKSGLITKEQGDALLNAADYTAPTAGIINGAPTVYQVNDKTGQPRVVPGVAPMPQKPLVSITNSAEKASEVEFGKLEAGEFSKVLKRGQDAQDKAQSIRALLSSPAKTGPTQDIRASANAFFKDLGVPIAQSKIDQIKEIGQYKALVNQVVLTETQKQNGVQTEKDSQRIEASFASTKNITEANQLILKYQLAVAERETLLSEKAEAFRESKGKIDGWRKELRQYVRNTPLAANNPKSGRLVFWNEYLEQMKQANPESSEEEIMDNWRKNYAAR